MESVLFKKEDKQQIENYRPNIHVQVCKIFMTILKYCIRYSLQLSWNQGKEQTGFRKGYSTTDQIFFTLNNIIVESIIEIYFMFIDFHTGSNRKPRVGVEIIKISN